MLFLCADVLLYCRTAGQPWSCCPRSALKRTLAALESRFGLTLMVGFELEFVLLKPAPLELFRTFPAAAAGSNVIVSNGQAWVPVDASIYCQASAICPGTHAGMQRGCIRLAMTVPPWVNLLW